MVVFEGPDYSSHTYWCKHSSSGTYYNTGFNFGNTSTYEYRSSIPCYRVFTPVQGRTVAKGSCSTDIFFIFPLATTWLAKEEEKGIASTPHTAVSYVPSEGGCLSFDFFWASTTTTNCQLWKREPALSRKVTKVYTGCRSSLKG